jgi:hypothetical protein
VGEAGGWCPVPNEILDRLMPELRDTEFRLLCVVCRTTLGRRYPVSGKRKRRDWMSHAQLMRRTGRGSGAVSRERAALIKRGVVACEAEDGSPLQSPRARRSHRGRVYLSLTPSLWESVESNDGGGDGAASVCEPSPCGPKRPTRNFAAVRIHRGWERAGRVRARNG